LSKVSPEFGVPGIYRNFNFGIQILDMYTKDMYTIVDDKYLKM